MNSEIASELFAPIRRLAPSSLHTLRLTTKHQGREVPTVGGFLLFGRNRFDRFADAWLQVGRFAGRERARIVDSGEVHSHLPQAPDQAIAFLQKYLNREAMIAGTRHVDRWTIPFVALRETIINAVVHTDYGERGAPIRVAIFDDRIEVAKPGILRFGLTIEDIRKGVSKLRNRVIGRVFHELGLIELWGSGIQRMTAACEEAGLPAPTFEEEGAHFRVVLSAVRTGPIRIDESDQVILRLLEDGRGRSTAEIANSISLSHHAPHGRACPIWSVEASLSGLAVAPRVPADSTFELGPRRH